MTRQTPTWRRNRRASRRMHFLQRLHRRDLILLTGVVSLACFSVIVVAVLILRSQPMVLNPDAVSEKQTATPGPQPTHTVTYVVVTALKQYDLAEAATRAWSDDARLVSASADWPQVIELEQVGAPVDWSYRFYSQDKERLLFVVVAPDGAVEVIEHAITVTLPPRPVETGAWLIDSPGALAIWLDYGGAEMLRTNPGLEIAVQLQVSGRYPMPVWVVVGVDDRTEDINMVVIDASQGVVIKSSFGS